MTSDHTFSPTDLVLGVLAGAAGTLAMDLLWHRRHQREDEGETPFVTWEFSTGADSFDDVGAPAHVARKLAGAAGVDIPERHAGLANDAVHWLTGTGWGVAASALSVTAGVAPVPSGLTAGAAAFGTAYLLLGAAGVYQPIWKYDRRTLRRDATAHLLFGTATGLTLAALRAFTGRL